MIVIELVYNLSVLVAFSVISGFIDLRFKRTEPIGKIFQGILFGLVSIIGMLYPFVLTEGIIFDGRSIVISLCAFFFGPLSGVITALTAAVFRISLGGGGIAMGLLVISTSYLIGFLFYRWRKNARILKVKKIHIYLLGLIVHLFMLLYILALPSDRILETYKTIAFTVIGIYPLITLIIGKILLDQQLNQSYLEDISRNEQLFRTTFYSIGDGVITTDKDGYIKQMNRIAEELTGWTEAEAKGIELETVFNAVNEETGIKIENPVKRVIETETITGVDKTTVLVSKNGKRIPIADSAAPILNEKENLIGVVLVFRDQTAERESAKKLKESGRQLSTLMSNLPGMAYRCNNDPQWTMVFVSEGCFPLTGFQFDELLYNRSVSYSQVIHPDFTKYVWDEVQKAVDRKKPFQITYKIIPKSGEEKWVWEQGRGVFNETGELLFLEGFIADITEQKHFEEQLKISENLLSNAIEGAEIGLWEQDFQTGITIRSEKWATMLGYSPNEISDTHDFWRSIINPDDIPGVNIELEKHESGITPYCKIEHRLKCKDGSYKWVLNWGKIYQRDENGKPLKASGIHLDIDKIVRAQEALKESEQRYRLIADNTVDSITILDLNLRTTYVSPSIFKLRGYTVEEAMGQTLDQILTPDSLEKANTLFREQMLLESTGNADPSRSILVDLEEYCKDGSTIWVELTASFLRDKDLNPIGILTVTRDISDWKRAEEARQLSEERYRLISEVASDYMFSSDADENNNIKLNWVAGAFEKITGYSLDEYVAKGGWRAALHPDDIEIDNRDVELLRNNKKVITELRTIAKNGNVVWVRVYAHPVWDNKNQRINGIYGAVQDITSAKKIENALQKSEALYRLIAEYTADVIWVLDLTKQKFKYVSPSVYKLRGFTAEEVVAQELNHALTPQSAQKVKKLIEQRVKQFFDGELKGNSFIDEVEQPCKDGSIVTTEVTTTYYLNEEKQIEIIGVSRDITERKKAEELIRISEERYRNIVERTNALLISTDIRGRFTYLNEAACRILGLNYDEAIGQFYLKYVHPDSRKLFHNSMLKVIEELTPNMVVDVKILTKSGDIAWLSFAIHPVFENDKIVGLSSVTLDITEKKLAEEALRENERMLRVTAEETNSVFYKLNFSNMRYDYIHPGIYDLTGYTPEEINETGLACHVINIVSIEGEEIDKKSLASTRNATDFRRFFADYQIRSKSGELKWLGDRSYSLTDENGKVIGSIGILTDITSRKKVEQELINAKEKAEEMSRVKSFFFANMSHELRTPLIGIMGYSEILQDVVANDENALNMAKTIHKSGTRLLDTLNNILRISKIESEKVDCHPENKNIVPILREIVNLYTPAAKNRNVDMELTYSPKEIICSIDERLFRDVINNLINNSIKYTVEGKISVRLSITEKNVVIKVKDTGIGIPEERQKIIWEAFRQVSEGFGRGFEGTGLGLTISKRYIELMGGTISLISQEGIGSEFVIELPITLEQKLSEETGVDNKIIEDKSTNTKPGVKRHNILYVENEAVSASFVEIVLSSKYNVDIASSSDAALEKVRKKKYDTILLDINLGKGLNGLELSEAIRKIPGYSTTPFVAVTAYAMEEEKAEFLARGLTHYLSKPFGKNEILELMDSIFL